MNIKQTLGLVICLMCGLAGNLQAGSHTAQVQITTEMGKGTTGEAQIEVVENTPPVCSIESRIVPRSLYLYYYVTADCVDPDGRVNGFEWTIDGETVSTSSQRLSIRVESEDALPAITLISIDDAGGRSDKVGL